MHNITKYFLGMILLCATLSVAWADSFTVNKIDIQGLQRISRGTVLNYLPIKVGDKITTGDTSGIIKSLFETGFFQDIKLERSGDTLIIKVKERPTVGAINLKGNKSVPSDKLLASLKELGLAQGRVFDRSLLNNVQKALQSQYFSLGRYNAEVETSVTDISPGRVAVNIDISEGTVAKIQQISIVGNKTFPTKTLLKEFKLTTPTLFSFITRSDQYSKAKLDGDVETLKSYYMDRGYVEFKVDSTEVTITPDRKGIYIVISVTEGPMYNFQGYKLAGKLILPKEELDKEVKFSAGEVFSRKKVVDTISALGDALGNVGYSFANVNAQPEIDKAKRLVMMTFYIDPGKRIYVHRIGFTGNAKTSDLVLRREMRQMEGGLVSVKNIKESERRLRLLGYLSDVSVKTPLAPGTDDQVDLDFNVKEEPSASASVSLGISTEGPVFGASINQSNFLGTGKALNVSFNKAEWSETYSMSYTNPYYTPDGISRSFSFYASKFDPDRINLTSYTTDTLGGDMSFGIPISDDDSVYFTLGYRHTRLRTGSDPSEQVQSFADENGNEFSQALTSIGWNRNGYDQYPFPNKGASQSVGMTVSAPLNSSSKAMEYYLLNYTAHVYQPINKYLIFSLKGNVGYGGGYGSANELPFFDNYFAGGIDSIRGYETNSLGPRDSNNDAIGGNLLFETNFGFILQPLSSEKVRTTVFFDAGNVFNTYDDYIVRGKQQGGVSFSDLRYSVGLFEQWRSPIGPLEFSLAYPIKGGLGGEDRIFDFNIGTSF